MNTDHKISRVFILFSVSILGYWAYNGIISVWEWYGSTGGYSSSWWPDLGRYLWKNISIVVVIYAIICLQASGLAELKFKKNFLKALGLSILLTPPVMMIVYGRRN